MKTENDVTSTDGSEKGEIVDTTINGGRIEYVAEYPDGRRIKGELTRGVFGPHTRLTDSALEDIADDLIGSGVDPIPNEQ